VFTDTKILFHESWFESVQTHKHGYLPTIVPDIRRSLFFLVFIFEDEFQKDDFESCFFKKIDFANTLIQFAVQYALTVSDDPEWGV
jgi:hypothetical protein